LPTTRSSSHPLKTSSKLADISKINAVALADIAKLDAVLAANIAKVNGLVFTTAGIAAPAAAYSVRLLDSSVGVPTYTGAAMRVRRETAGGTGDDDEADIAFDSGVVSLDSAISNASAGVTATTLGQFLNVGTVGGTTYTNPDSLTVTASCLVDTWYDQSGNANDATQATQGDQPQIHDGTVNTDLINENGQPAVEFNATSSTYGLDTPAIDITPGHVICVTRFDSTTTSDSFCLGSNTTEGLIRARGTTPNISLIHTYTNSFQCAYEKVYRNSTDLLQLSPTVRQGFAGSMEQQNLFFTDDATTNNVDFVHIGKNGTNNGVTRWVGTIQEVIAYDSDQSDNRTGIEENINSEYLIYQPTDTPTSGLLATYTGAAAAYSVRQLADTAVIAITVRRDSDDEEKRFGFDANGDLDTAGITSFCGTANGYVSQWWDQSTNGNHASQGTQASQPQIYNGTAVITENGKPALEFDGSDDGLTLSSLTYGNALSIISVYNQTDDLRGRIWCDDITGQQGYWILFGAETQNEGFDQRKFYFNDGTGFDSKLHQNAPINQQNLLNVFFTSSQMIDSLNGNAQTQSITGFSPPIDLSGSSAGFAIANSGNMTQAAAMKGQEFILYHSDESSNRTGIETDINDYFSIY